MNRFERTQNFNEKKAAALAGTGVFVYVNNSRADIMLEKKTNEGFKTVVPGQQFRGDSFFKKMLGRGLALVRDETPVAPVPVVETIKETPKNEGKVMEEKLILDQPETVTTQGKVEQVVKTSCGCKCQKKLNEVQPTEPCKVDDALISEDPLAGVEIITD